MKFHKFHSWEVTPDEAIAIQRKLKKRLSLKRRPGKITSIAGCDVAFDEEKNRAFAAVVVLSFPGLELIEKRAASKKMNFPYVPGLLSFREAPALLAAFKELKTLPSLAIFDGQGVAHPRRMGLASHMGILLDLPTIGCAKSRLFGRCAVPKVSRGSFTYIKDRDEVIGATLRTRKGVKPVFVSVGHRIDLPKAVKVVLAASPKYRIPEPLRKAHALAERTRLEN